MRRFFTACCILISFLGSSQDINIPDSVFLDKLIDKGVDTNEDGIIQESEALAISSLNVSSAGSQDKIEDMEGIQYFTNLIGLECENNEITALDVTALTNLEALHCYSNAISSLNITGLNQLNSLWAWDNQLVTLDVSGLDNIWWIWISENFISEIDLNGLTSLESIWIYNNQLETIDFTSTPNLNDIDVSGNLLTEIEVNQLYQLERLNCSNNQIEAISIEDLANLHTLHIGNNMLEEIDGSQSPNLIELHCESNPNLEYINMKNGALSYADPDMLYQGFNFYDLPELSFVCIDSGEEYALSESGYNPDNVVVSTTDCTMAVSEFDKQELAIYPNPVGDNFQLSNARLVSEFTVFNLSGKQLINTPHYETAKKYIVSLNPGMYFLQVQNDEKNTKNLKFIKK